MKLRVKLRHKPRTKIIQEQTQLFAPKTLAEKLEDVERDHPYPQWLKEMFEPEHPKYTEMLKTLAAFAPRRTSFQACLMRVRDAIAESYGIGYEVAKKERLEDWLS